MKPGRRKNVCVLIVRKSESRWLSGPKDAASDVSGKNSLSDIVEGQITLPIGMQAHQSF